MARGFLKKRGDSWSLVVEQERDPETGKRRQKWITIRGTRKQAEQERTRILSEMDRGMYVVPGKDTVSDFLDRWLTDYCQPNLSPRALERYQSICRVHLAPAIGAHVLTRLQPAHIQAMYAAKLSAGLSPRTVKYLHVVLHKALVTALKWGVVGRNVADGVDVPRAHRTEMQTWDETEIVTFLEATKDSAYSALFYTALATGARRSELLALRWQDVDLIARQVSISRSLHHLAGGSYIFTQPKTTKSNRTIALTPSNALILKSHWETAVARALMTGTAVTKDTLVFGTLDNKPLRPNTVSRAWKNLARRAAVKVIRLHDARHTHASLLLKQGVHPKIVQERLGHASIQITLDTYSHVAPGMQEAAALRFDELLPGGYNGLVKNEAVENVR